MNNSVQELSNALRNLSMDCVENAGSGHPGMPMGMADVASVLWLKHLRHNPRNTNWCNRDRFVLSNGHGSALLYSLLHLTGYDLSLDELRRFRTLGSATPGHPELGCTPGVETTTGPLGQGLANAVGMALAEKLLALEFNREDFEIVNHRTYAFVGDGCLMEGLSHEVCSLAGTWKLGNLMVFWDDNGISIDGKVSGWFSDNTAQRFQSYGWHVISDVDGHDPDRIDAAIVEARERTDAPTLICCRTVIGKGAPSKAGSAEVHGAPLGKQEYERTREALGWKHAPFKVPKELYGDWDSVARGAADEEKWLKEFSAYKQIHPLLAQEFVRRLNGVAPDRQGEITSEIVAGYLARRTPEATRKSSQDVIAKLATGYPELLGGSADLTGSNLTRWEGAKTWSGEEWGNYIHYGVREFGMASIMNGIALHGGYRPFGGTFLVFSDYARNAMRMSALMRLSVIYVLTHDSIGLGADGPTHQPVEQLASLRQIPNMNVWRPCDALETAVSWNAALTSDGTPTCIVLSRQSLPAQSRSNVAVDAIEKGGYVLYQAPGRNTDLVLLATGSEVAIAVEAAKELEKFGRNVRVVSMPSTFTFDSQSEAYKQEVLPRRIPRIAIEAASTDFWRKYVGLDGRVLGMERFGESGDSEFLFDHFGINVRNLVEMAKSVQ